MPEYLVRYISWDIAHPPGRRVAPYDGRARYVERGERGLVRCVRDVDEDTETVELPHEDLTKWTT